MTTDNFLSGKIEGYSFAEALREYEEWVQNVSSSIPRIKCKEQMVKMSAYHFETDKIENAPQTLGDGGNLEEVKLNLHNPIHTVRAVSFRNCVLV